MYYIFSIWVVAHSIIIINILYLWWPRWFTFVNLFSVVSVERRDVPTMAGNEGNYNLVNTLSWKVQKSGPNGLKDGGENVGKIWPHYSWQGNYAVIIATSKIWTTKALLEAPFTSFKFNIIFNLNMNIVEYL